MLSLIIAGGSFVGALITPQQPDMINHTLRGERVLASEVVCRNMWGTPMLPNGKGGYSLIAPVNQEFIAQSLIQPPITASAPGYPFRPVTVTVTSTTTTIISP